MENRKELIKSIIRFLKLEFSYGHLDDDGKEGLEVAIQVLESTYNIQDCNEATIEPSLLEIYEASSLRKSYTKRNKQASDEDKLAAEKMKLNGNEQMKSENFAGAVQSYSEAIDLDSSNAVYYCNRAAAYTKLNENIKAIADCQSALTIDPNYSKAYGRMGLVYMNEKNFEKAVKAYEKATEHEPQNLSYKNNLELAKEKLTSNQNQANEGGGGRSSNSAPGGGAAPNPLANMDLNSLLSNPAVMNLAQSFMQNPQMQNMFSSMMGSGPQQTPASDTTPPPPNITPSNSDSASGATPEPNQGLGGMFPQGMDFSNIMSATQQFANQMRQQNPDLVDNLRSQFQQGDDIQPPQPPDENDKNTK